MELHEVTCAIGHQTFLFRVGCLLKTETWQRPVCLGALLFHNRAAMPAACVLLPPLLILGEAEC